jgi:tetratricopeptide (TPR) repeat protein
MANARFERRRIDDLLSKATLYGAAGDLDQEGHILTDAKEACRRLARLDPGTNETATRCARTYFQFGQLQARTGQRAAACQHIKTAISILRRVASAEKGEAQLPWRLVEAQEVMGSLLLDDGDLEGAQVHFRDAIAIVSGRAAEDSEARRLEWLVRLHAGMSRAALAARDGRAAMNHAEEAARLASLRIGLQPQEPHALEQRGYAIQWIALSHLSAGRTLAGHRSWQAALDQFRRAAALAVDHPGYWRRLALELETHAEQMQRSGGFHAGRDLLAEAVEVWRRVVALEPGTPANRGALGNALNLVATADRDLGKDPTAGRAAAEALTHLRAALEAGGEEAVPGLPAAAVLGLEGPPGRSGRGNPGPAREEDLLPTFRLGSLPERFIPLEAGWRQAWQSQAPRRREAVRLVSAEAEELKRGRDALRTRRLELTWRRRAELATRAAEDLQEGTGQLVLAAKQAYRRAEDERYAAELAQGERDEANHRARSTEAERRWMGQLSIWIEEDRSFKQMNAGDGDAAVGPRMRTLPN